jgi:hypothetical protein
MQMWCVVKNQFEWEHPTYCDGLKHLSHFSSVILRSIRFHILSVAKDGMYCCNRKEIHQMGKSFGQVYVATERKKIVSNGDE